ncbi:hypothetical protein Pcinc_028241 [Petrolisthes cinctipes]|uniref:Uncharacterized protein n=1 Tax=Petrolisthes cinctipes TaxID=88211 RepID=A0AAE1F3J6_PETCI|nr:hypothetical protein Pcinc_028241 [Petrolisthes cinctipes]
MVRDTTAMTEHSGAEEGGAVSAAGEEAIRTILSSLRDNMKGEDGGGGVVGQATAGLDPLLLDPQILSHQHPAVNTMLRLHSMALKGLSEFIIEDVKVNVRLLTVTVSLSYDTLLLEGQYDLQGKLVKVIPVSARGPFTITTTNSRVTLRAKLKEYRGRLEVRDMNTEVVFEGVRCHLAQMTGGAMVSKILNPILTDNLERERHKVASSINLILKTALNNELKNYNLGVSLQLLRTSDKLMRRASLY